MKYEVSPSLKRAVTGLLVTASLDNLKGTARPLCAPWTAQRAVPTKGSSCSGVM